MTDLEAFIRWQRLLLGEDDGSRFSDGLLSEALRQALQDYAAALPRVRSVEQAAVAGGVQVIGGAADWLFPLEIAFANLYGAGDWLIYHGVLAHRMEAGGVRLELHDQPLPLGGETMRLTYAAAHSLEGLDGALQTTPPAVHWAVLAQGAAGQAALLRCAGLSEAQGGSPAGIDRLRLWGERTLAEFHTRLAGLRVQTQPGLPLAPATLRWRLDAWDG
jgi:hypothetical protein